MKHRIGFAALSIFWMCLQCEVLEKKYDRFFKYLLKTFSENQLVKLVVHA